MSPIISVKEFKEALAEKKLIILDARAGKDSYTNYLKQHIKGAQYIDLEQDLANVPKDAANGGRHPLPEIFDFAKTLSDLGISENTHIIIYDDKNGSNAAARCWWMLKAFGIEKAQVLNGGFYAAKNAEIIMNSGKESIHQSSLKIPDFWKLPLSEMNDVEQEISDNTATVIDVRDFFRFRGDSEPIDLIAGHIPGAINIPFSENLDENGMFLPPEILKEKYEIYYKKSQKN